MESLVLGGITIAIYWVFWSDTHPGIEGVYSFSAILVWFFAVVFIPVNIVISLLLLFVGWFLLSLATVS